MRVSTQVRLVHGSMIGAAVLLGIVGALSWVALAHLDALHLKWVSEAQITRARIDLLNGAVTATVSALIAGGVAVFMIRPSGKARVAVWITAPVLALTTLCFLVGGPQYAVAPTGEEPAEVRAEYAQVVPDWYSWPHGVAGVLAAALLIFAAVFMLRGDLREHYMEADYDPARPYTSWVERTGGV
jgi:hypothetical protein